MLSLDPPILGSSQRRMAVAETQPQYRQIHAQLDYHLDEFAFRVKQPPRPPPRPTVRPGALVAKPPPYPALTRAPRETPSAPTTTRVPTGNTASASAAACSTAAEACAREGSETLR
jgi:hypothetical protein